MKASGLIAGGALVALLLAGCGGDNSASVSNATTSGGSSTASTSAPDASTTTPSFTGNANSEFCAFAKDVSNNNFANDLSSDPNTLKSDLDKLNNAINSAKDTAPSEIKDDVTTLADAFQKYRDFFAQYDFDVAKLTAAAQKDPKILQQASDVFSDPKIEAASNRIQAYSEQVCGTSPDTTT